MVITDKSLESKWHYKLLDYWDSYIVEDMRRCRGSNVEYHISLFEYWRSVFLHCLRTFIASVIVLTVVLTHITLLSFLAPFGIMFGPMDGSYAIMAGGIVVFWGMMWITYIREGASYEDRIQVRLPKRKPVKREPNLFFIWLKGVKDKLSPVIVVKYDKEV